MRKSSGLLGLGLCLCLPILYCLAVPKHPPTVPKSSGDTALPRQIALRTAAAYGRLPLSFESNQGQANSEVQFLSHTPNYDLFLTSNEAVLSLQRPQGETVSVPSRTHSHSPIHPQIASRRRTEERKGETKSVLRLKLLGANAHPEIAGAEKLPGDVNYFIGNDPSRWRSHVPTYSRVSYKRVYPGIDMVYYGSQQQLEYDWVVAPGADVHQIHVGICGANHVTLTPGGDLKLETSAGDVVQHAPVAYQEVDGIRRPVSARLVLEKTAQGTEERQIGFGVASYDPTRPLVIDPVLVYSTYLSALEAHGTYGIGIAVDAIGNAYVTGFTNAPNFPTEVPYQATNNADYTDGYNSIFVSVLNASGTALVYSTYLGGSVDKSGQSNSQLSAGIAVDGSGNAYITGWTGCADFPVKNALQPNINNLHSVFVTKLNPTGSDLVYSTYLGGSDTESGTGIAADSSGNAYVTGQTSSTDFPLLNAYQSTNHSLDGNAFVTKINPTGSALVYSTYLGGSTANTGGDAATGIAVDASGNANVIGNAYSTDFPVLNAYQSTNHSASSNAFISRFSASGGLLYSTYLGGSTQDLGTAIAVDSAGNAYVTGQTYDTDFPVVNALQPTNHCPNGGNVFVTKLSSEGNGLIYSTYLGGSGSALGVGDEGAGIGVDGAGNAYITGGFHSPDFPLKNAMQNLSPEPVGFVTEINANGSALVYSTFFGGWGIAVDSYGNAYLVSSVNQDLPVQSAFQSIAPSQEYPNASVARIGNYNWQTVDVSVGNDSLTRLLWVSSTRTVGLWSVNNIGQASNFTNTGPFTGYTVQATAAGSDGITRVLWNNIDGTVALWLLNANNTFNNGFNYGPYVNDFNLLAWSAVDVAVGSDNKTRLLWNKTDGTAGVWTVDNTGATGNLRNYGPYTGWTANRIACGSDGLTRLLWTKNDGTVALWLLNADNTFSTGFNFTPLTGWRAIDIAVGSDNKARILWNKSDGTASIWTVDNSGATTSLTNIGPYPGWTASKIASGSDGLSRLLWFKGDGTQAIWLLNANNTLKYNFSFGPY